MILNSNSSWLKTADATDGDVLTFVDEGRFQENTKFPNPDGTPKQEFIITATHNGVDKNIRLNKTNQGALIKEYGSDTSAWVGKVAVITKVTGMIAGKKQEMMVLETDNANQE